MFHSKKYFTLLLLSHLTLIADQPQTRANDGQNWRIISRGSFGASAVGYAINNPGNYMLSESVIANPGNTTGIIQINTDDVVLDLGGHTLNGTGTTGKGIIINGKRNITIKNGHLNAVQSVNIHSMTGSNNVRLENITLTNPGPGVDIQLDASNAKLTGITLIGNGSAGNSITTANNLNDIIFEKIHVSNVTGKAIAIGNSCYNMQLKSIEIDTCLGTNNGIALGTSCYDIFCDGFRLSNISSDGIAIGASCFGITFKNGSLINCLGNGLSLGTSTYGITLGSLLISGCNSGIFSAGTSGAFIDNCIISKCTGTAAYGCKLTNSQNIFITNSKFFESTSAGNAVTGLWLVTCSNISCSQVQSGGHSGAQAYSFKLDTNCSGCTFENCLARSNTATSATTGQGAFGFSFATAKGCTITNCLATNNQGALLAAGFYLLNCSTNTFINCQALENNTTTSSANALAAGFYSMSGSSNKFQLCQSNGQSAGNTASNAGCGAFGFYFGNEQQSSLSECKALGNGALTTHAATAAGFYFDGTVNPACKYMEIRNCTATSNCTSATTGITAFGFLDSATATTNIIIDCFASSNSDNAALRIVTNYWANLPIGGTTAANFPKVEATIDGLLDIANKPPFYNVSITS